VYIILCQILAAVLDVVDDEDFVCEVLFLNVCCLEHPVSYGAHEDEGGVCFGRRGFFYQKMTGVSEKQ